MLSEYSASLADRELRSGYNFLYGERRPLLIQLERKAPKGRLWWAGSPIPAVYRAEASLTELRAPGDEP